MPRRLVKARDRLYAPHNVRSRPFTRSVPAGQLWPERHHACASYPAEREAAVTVTVSSPVRGVAGANAALHALRARVVVVPVRPGCPAIGTLPRPKPAPHPATSVGSSVGKNGHRAVTVKVGKGGIPKGDTLILAFSGNPRGGGSVGAGGIITGRVPSCVSLPPMPHGGMGTGSTSTVTQAG